MGVSQFIDSLVIQTQRLAGLHSGDSSIGHPHPNCPGFRFFQLWSLSAQRTQESALTSLTGKRARDACETKRAQGGCQGESREKGPCLGGTQW